MVLENKLLELHLQKQQKNKILTNNTGAIILSELEAQDIDNVVDWKLAELKYELLQSIK